MNPRPINQWQPPSEEMTLDEKEVHLWLFHLNISQPRIKQFYPLLSSEEKQRSERLVNYIHRKRQIAAHGFLRSVLSSYLPQSPDQLEFKKSPRGKPFLPPQKNPEDLRFNMTHSHNLALIAVCKQHEIGIDIEYMEKKHEWKKITRRFFTTAEQDAIFALPEDQQHKAFSKVWTRKEAHMKVTGEGLHLSPSKFTVSVPPTPPEFIEYLSADNDLSWHMKDIDFPQVFEQYCGCFSMAEKFSQVKHFIFP